MAKKIIYISGTRADYGLMRETLFRIQKTPGLSPGIIATGMHLMPEFGMTLEDIKRDGFKDIQVIPATYRKDNRRSMAEFIGKFISLFTVYLSTHKPDIILLLGDRAEMLAAAVAGVYAGDKTIIAHIHGGEITSTVDESARHAITKLAHIHLCATPKAAERVIKMGEDKKNVHIVGAPGLDAILSAKYTPPHILAQKYKFDRTRPLAILVQHPVTAEISEAPEQISATISALVKKNIRTIIIYPNADAGGRKMISVIKKFVAKTGSEGNLMSAYPSIPREDYLGLMRCASFIIGNSSSGIIEAPSLGLPAINIGTRQSGRERAENVIDTGYAEKDIIKAIDRVLNDKKFLKKISSKKNPYGDGKTADRIAGILEKIQITPQLLQKKLAY